MAYWSSVALGSLSPVDQDRAPHNTSTRDPTIVTNAQLHILVGGGIDDVCPVIYGMYIARNCQRGIS